MKYLMVVLIILSFSNGLFAKETRRAKIEDPTKYSVRINGAVNWRGEDRKSIAIIKSNFVISGTMKFKRQTAGGYSKTFEIDRMRVNYSHLAQIYKKKPDKNCFELMKFEVEASGSLPITEGLLRIRSEEKVPASHPIKQSMLEFSFSPGTVPGKMKILDHCKYTTREVGLGIAYVNVIDTSKITKDQTSFSGSRSFGIPPDTTNIEGLSRMMPFIFSDKVLSGGPSSLPKEIESILSSAGDNLVEFKGFSTGGKAGMPPGNDAKLTWKIKIGPSVEIWRDDKDITDQVQDVLIGEKIKLKAVVQPHDESSKGVWKIPESVISGFVADGNRGKVILLEEEQKKNPDIEFFFTDGEFSKGKPFEITYTADDKKLEGKTTFKVFKPMVRMEKKWKSPHIDIWPVEKDKVCRLYLGDRSRLPRGAGLLDGEIDEKKTKEPNKIDKELSKRAARDIAGIFIDSTITLPTPFSNREHLLGYCQLIKEDVLTHQDLDYFYEGSKNDWILDTHFPYGNRVAERELYLDDSPNTELDWLTKQVHHYQSFKTFLMFRPSKDDKSVWVPLKLVTWEWKASAIRQKDVAFDKVTGVKIPVQPSDFKLITLGIPSPKEMEWSGKPEDYPQWKDNIVNKKRESVYTNWNKYLSDKGFRN